MNKGLLKEIFPGRRLKSLTSEELRVYRQEWARRNTGRITARKIARRPRERELRRERMKDPAVRERRRIAYKAWIATNGHRTPAYYKKYRLKAEYGLTLEAYRVMRERQGGVCALCGRGDSGRTKWKDLCVDHDHATGRVRDLLCHQCNMVLGHSRDDAALLRRMAAYIESHRREGCLHAQAELCLSA